MHSKSDTNVGRNFRRAFQWPLELFLLLTGFSWLYWHTMPPGISSWLIEGWDSAVLQLTGSTWGIPHSPAYPLYTILANLFVRWLYVIPGLTDTSVVWRVSYWSTITSLLTLVFLYFTIWKLTRHRVTAFVVSVIVGISFVFWRAAIMAEVYSLNALIFALTYWLALTWASKPRQSYLILLGLVLGAGVVHHRTAWILPPTIALGVILISLQENTTLKIRFVMLTKRLMVVVSMACLPLLTYLYLPWAATYRVGQTWLYANAADWNTFWFMVFTREWWGLVQPPATTAEWLVALSDLLSQQIDQITLPGVILGIMGLLMAYRYGWLFGPPLLTLTFFGTAYKVADLDSMLIPLTLTLCVGIGVALGTSANLLTRWSILFIHIQDVKRKWVRQGVSWLLSLILLGGTYVIFSPQATATYEAVDLSQDWQAADLVEEVVAIAEAGTPLTIIGQDNSVLPDFIYAQVVLGYDIEPLSTTALSRMPSEESQALLQSRLVAHHRLFIDKESVDLGFIPWLNEAIRQGYIFMAPTGHPYLWELLLRPTATTLPQTEGWQLITPNGQFLSGQLSVVAAHQKIVHKRTGCFLRLTLFWQTHSSIEADYYLAYMPLGGEMVVDKVDHLALMRGYLPTSQLLPEEIVRDEVDLLIRQPTNLPFIDLVVNLYQVQGDQFPSFGQVTLPITVDPSQCE